MTQFIGRMRCTDKLQLRTKDEELEEALGPRDEEVTASELSEIERQHASQLSAARRFQTASAELHGNPAPVEDDTELTPLQRFKRASDRRHDIGRGDGK